jgi:hypothetical protein
MRRREFVTLLGAWAATWSRIARAQQAPKIAKIGVLSRHQSAIFAVMHSCVLAQRRANVRPKPEERRPMRRRAFISLRGGVAIRRARSATRLAGDWIGVGQRACFENGL